MMKALLSTATGGPETLPLGTYAVVSGLEPTASDNDLPPGVIFCLRAVRDAAAHAAEPGYPLSPNLVVHVGHEGEVLLPCTQAKQVLDRLKKTAIGRDVPHAQACACSEERRAGDSGVRTGRRSGWQR